MAARPEIEAQTPTPTARSAWGAIGLVMLAHVAFLAALKTSREIEGEMLWVSHASLALGGVALLLGSVRLVRIAFASVFVLHAIWLVDCVAGLATGSFPFGLTEYVASADWQTLAGTSHHVYLVPLLWVFLRRAPAQPRVTTASVVLCALVFVGLLTLAGRWLVPMRLNVNLAHALMPESTASAFIWFNALPAPAYLVVHLAFVLTGALIPGALIAPRNGTAPMRTTSTHSTRPARARTPHRAAFTLIELIAVIVVLAILSGVALPRYFDYSERAKQSAAEGSVAGIRTALHNAFLDHRLSGAPASAWITSVNQIPSVMESGELPSGMKIVGARIEDQQGNRFNLVAETADTPARLTVVVSGGGS